MLVKSTKYLTQENQSPGFYSVNISDVSGSSRRLRENSGTGLYIHSSVLACDPR